MRIMTLSSRRSRSPSELIIPDPDDDIYDMSTPAAQINRFIFKFKWVIYPLAILVIPLILLFLVYALSASSTTPEPPIILSLPSSQDPSLRIIGNENKPIIEIDGTTSYYQDFDPFPLDILANVTDKGSVQSLEIRYYKIHGPSLSNQLQNYPNLATINLINVTITQYLTPVHLPNLSQIKIYQILNSEQRNSGNYTVYNGEAVHFLASTFFYMENYTNFPTALSSIAINTEFWLDGSIVYFKNPSEKELRISLNQCHDVLTSPSISNYEKFTLGNCDDLTAVSVPQAAKYLNIYIIFNMTTFSLNSMLKNLVNLEVLFIEIPYKDLELDLNYLPRSLKSLSISSLKIGDTGTALESFPSISKFYYGSANEYTFSDSTQYQLPNEFITNFSKIFPNLQEIGIFELRVGRYKFLKAAINSTANRIIVQGFSRTFDDEDIDEMEAELSKAGVPYDEFFVLKKVGGVTKGTPLNYEQQIEMRYRMLGWNTIDSWQKYTHVRTLLDNGFLL